MGGPQHGETLLGGREFPVACPCLGPKAWGVGWLVAATVPNTSFALVEADVGMCFQVVGRQGICHPERRTRFLQAGAVFALLVALAVGPRKTKPASRGFLVLRLRLG